MLNKYILLLVFMILVSCKGQFDINKDVKFITKTKTYTESLSLFKNNKFEYSYKAKLSNQSSSGSWIKEGDSIVLISDEKYKTGVIAFEEKVDKSINGTRIIILDHLNEPLIGAGITINENPNKGWNTNEKGQVIIPRKEITSITIHYITHQNYPYKVKNIESNSFLVKIKMHELSVKYFNQEVWKLKNGKLINPLGVVFSN